MNLDVEPTPEGKVVFKLPAKEIAERDGSKNSHRVVLVLGDLSQETIEALKIIVKEKLDYDLSLKKPKDLTHEAAQSSISKDEALALFEAITTRKQDLQMPPHFADKKQPIPAGLPEKPTPTDDQVDIEANSAE